MLSISILFEDQHLALVEKPAGVVVNRAETVKEETLQDWWEEYLKGKPQPKWQTLVPADLPLEYGTPEEIFAQRGGVVHRLDKETSGVMLLAKNPGALVNLLKQFREREVHKMYTCLVHGKFKVLEDMVTMPLGRSSFNRTKFAVDPDGRIAETAYKVVKSYSKLVTERFLTENDQSPVEVKNFRKKVAKAYQGFSLVQCWPKTGRTHQIRVHMLHLKHPIVADETYLGKKRSVLDEVWCPRLFLHATQLEFTHPRSGEKLHFTCPLPAELEKVLTYLEE